MISNPIYFQYKQHPGDVLRDNSVQRLPNFHDEKENFWIWFHPNYAGSQTVAYLNDLGRWLDGELTENEEAVFQNHYGALSEAEIKDEITRTELQLDFESLENFLLMISEGIRIVMNVTGTKRSGNIPK